MKFMEKLKKSWSKSDSLLCVGLDTEMTKMPAPIAKMQNPIFEFNKVIIDATADLVCAYKPQIAYYAAYRAEEQLEMTIEYIQQKYPSIVVVLDAKRGDIGATATLYAIEAFDRYKSDAVTVNPYMGGDSLKPFLDRTDKGVILLCRTSNPGAVDLQNLVVADEPLYMNVARKAASQWNGNQNLALVVGATYPKELKEVRAAIGDMPLLVPGVGAQGGDIQAAVSSGVDSQGTGMIINSSRAILYASGGADFGEAARKVAETTRNEINKYRKPATVI